MPPPSTGSTWPVRWQHKTLLSGDQAKRHLRLNARSLGAGCNGWIDVERPIDITSIADAS